MNSLKDIAESLGVSQSTVSRALSGSKGVSGALRARIMELARSHGFSPDTTASLLRTGKPHGLVMITPRGRSGVAVLRDGLFFSKARERFGSVSALALSEEEDLGEAIGKAASGRPGAILVCGSPQEIPEELTQSLYGKGVALLAVDMDVKGVDQIQIDRSSGTCQLARLFVLSGSKSPVFLSAYGADLANPDDRLSGIQRGLRSLGLELRPEQVVQLSPDTSSNPAKAGFDAVERILKTMFADAVFCYSDLCAIGAMRALLKNGVKVPDEVKMAGFDNLPFSEFLPVSLTTVAQPLDEAVDEAMRLLEERLSDFSAPPRMRSLKCPLVIRESSPVDGHALRQEVFRSV